MLLSELVKDWPCTVKGSIGVDVLGVTERSGAVKQGDLFVARKGKADDGIFHVEEAIRRGAIAIVMDRNCKPEMSRYPTVPIITVPDGRKFLSHVSAKLSGNPSELLTIIAVTGTNGKTTVTHFVGQLLHEMGAKAAVIGTTGIYMNGEKCVMDLPDMTTLPAEYLHPLLKKCVEGGITHVIMEASSLGLSTSRLDHCEIDIGVFLNIGVDHYEEHGSKQAYLAAKQLLANLSKEIIVNQDDEICIELVKNASKPTYRYNVNMTADVAVPKELYPTALLGRHNKSNAMAAVSVLMRLGYDQKKVLAHCHKLVLPEGRLQQIEHAGIKVYIDYAHTPDALQTVLQSLIEEFTDCPIITVFGCGGNRDRGKRPEMAKVAVSLSTKVMITSDNPRYEDPNAIIRDVYSGIEGESSNVFIEPNRRKAIETVIAAAKEGDIVLIAGKGHEKTQLIGGESFHFSDYEIAKNAILGKK